MLNKEHSWWRNKRQQNESLGFLIGSTYGASLIYSRAYQINGLDKKGARMYIRAL